MAEYVERKALRDALYDADAVTMKGVAIINKFPAVEAEPIHYGWWELRGEHPDGYDHHYCTNCNQPALFHYEYRPDYTEDYDGEWRYLCDVEDGISEFLTKRCPHCGARMGGNTYDENENPPGVP